MLILLPPSERKTHSRRGAPLDLDRLSFPELTATRTRVLDALVSICRDHPERAALALGLGGGAATEVLTGNAKLYAAPAVPVARLYSGVLYDALDVGSLSGTALRRARASLVVFSAAWGALRLTDRVPAYKLPIDVRLPGLPPLAGLWRPKLAGVMPAAAGRGLVVDLRSSGYLAAWPPDREVAQRAVIVQVLREKGGRRSVVSHMAKHYRGLLARHLLTGPELPADAAELADRAAQQWVVELDEAHGSRPAVLRLVVTD